MLLVGAHTADNKQRDYNSLRNVYFYFHIYSLLETNTTAPHTHTPSPITTTATLLAEDTCAAYKWANL